MFRLSSQKFIKFSSVKKKFQEYCQARSPSYILKVFVSACTEIEEVKEYVPTEKCNVTTMLLEVD